MERQEMRKKAKEYERNDKTLMMFEYGARIVGHHSQGNGIESSDAYLFMASAQWRSIAEFNTHEVAKEKKLWQKASNTLFETIYVTHTVLKWYSVFILVADRLECE